MMKVSEHNSALVEDVRSQTESQSGRELRRSIFAPLILFLYRLLGCRRRWRIARPLLKLILRLEGPMRSETARRIMFEFHGVEIAAYSYGDCFDPAIMPAGIKIGRYVSIASGVRMFVQNHPLDRLSTHPFFYERQPGISSTADIAPGRLEVGHDVWIGCNAIITPGCHRIGNGAVVGAGAVVTKDVPDFAIVAGNPAKPLRDRFCATVVGHLQRSQWWMLSIEEVSVRRAEFQYILDHGE